MRLVAPHFLALAALASATGCTTGSSSATPPVQVANVATEAKLQFVVGTATIAYPGGTVIGTNFVSTFRGTDGHSATLANTPTITGPPNFAIGFPGTPNSVTGVLPNVINLAVLTAAQTHGGALLPASLGASLGPLVGVFGYGMAADNLLSSQVAQQLAALNSLGDVCDYLTTGGSGSTNKQTSAPIAVPGTINGIQTGGVAPATSVAQSNELGLPVGYGQGANAARNNPTAPCPVSQLAEVPPVSDAFGANSPFPINYYGGPPAWPSAQGYGQPTFFVGYPVGFTDFGATPVLGTYELDVAYATNQSATTYGHFDANATLRSTTALAPLSIASATVNADGTGSVILSVPPGLFETIVFVRSQDCANPSLFDNYAVVTHSVGRQIFVFGANLGPPNSAGQPTQTFCTASNGSGNVLANAYAVGFDYPAYEASYPFNVSQSPQISNSNGQADVTTSIPFAFTIGS